MKQLFPVLIILSLLSSCRCYSEYETTYPKNEADTSIIAHARMWQAENENLTITIEIHKNDSFFVKDITVRPGKTEDFPSFHNFNMYSWYYDGNELTWKDFYADTFNELPVENRTTVKNGLYVRYEAEFQSKELIKVNSFSAEVEVLLEDKEGKPWFIKRKMQFVADRKCGLGAP